MEEIKDQVVSRTEVVTEEKTEESSTILEVGKSEKQTPKKRVPVSIDSKDYRYLRKNNYEEQKTKFTTTFVLQHIKHPEKIVELRAATSVHACHMIHWKPQQVRVLSTRTD